MQNGSPHLELEYHSPFAWESLLRFLAGRAIPGVELVEANRYARTIAIGGDRGWVQIEPADRENALRMEISPSLRRQRPALVVSIRHLFDLDARPRQIEAHLAEDELLRPIVARQPGLRLPGAFDPFEMAVRAILGQQVSVRAATTLAGRLAKAFGEPVETPHTNLNLSSITAARLASANAAEFTALGLTRARAECLLKLSRAVAEGSIELQPGIDAESAIEQLKQLPGIGDWTANYIAMRALHWPDAFPYADLGLRKAVGETSPKRMLELAEHWRPWRAYAVMHLWNSLGGTNG